MVKISKGILKGVRNFSITNTSCLQTEAVLEKRAVFLLQTGKCGEGQGEKGESGNSENGNVNMGMFSI
ncbi:hypothetical protein DOZ91_07795 [Peribacillus frigoritolerans]|nr:hypothetical protein DOZ91_07795 [Peribacillus frigoritolerans]